MVKTRRRNYNNVTFDDEDDVRDVSSTASEESGGSDVGGNNDDPGGDVGNGEKSGGALFCGVGHLVQNRARKEKDSENVKERRGRRGWERVL